MMLLIIAIRVHALSASFTQKEQPDLCGTESSSIEMPSFICMVSFAYSAVLIAVPFLTFAVSQDICPDDLAFYVNQVGAILHSMFQIMDQFSC
jgi:hypothetical protein